MANSNTRYDFATFAGRLRWVIERYLAVTQAEFARRVGVSRQLVNRWLGDPTVSPESSTINTIAGATGVPRAWLHYGEGEPPEPRLELGLVSGDEELVAEFLDASSRLSGREAAERVPGVSQHDVSRWRRGEWTRLTSAKKRALAAWLRHYRSQEMQPSAETEIEPEEVAPNYEGLGVDLPGYERLLERPRRVFDHFMVELIGKGLGREDLEELGRGLLNPIAALNTLHKGRDASDARNEEDQMMVLNGMMPVLRKIVREGGLR